MTRTMKVGRRINSAKVIYSRHKHLLIFLYNNYILLFPFLSTRARYQSLMKARQMHQSIFPYMRTPVVLLRPQSMRMYVLRGHQMASYDQQEELQSQQGVVSSHILSMVCRNKVYFFLVITLSPALILAFMEK